MCDFVSDVQCEEVFEEPTVVAPVVEEMMYINERLLLRVVVVDGKLKGVSGENIQAELIELNHVKITKNGFTDYLVLDENLQWLEVEN